MKNLIKLPSNNSFVGKLISADYDEFKTLIEGVDNIADAFAVADLKLAQTIEKGKDIKAIVDIEVKKAKNAVSQIRNYMTQYMEEKKIKKLEGTKIKSISFQAPKTVKKTVSEKQIKVGRSYVSLKDLTKDDLVQLLEKKGVKTKIVSKEIEEFKSEGIIVKRI